MRAKPAQSCLQCVRGSVLNSSRSLYSKDLQTHGAGLINHQSLANPAVPIATGQYHSITQAAPAADLFRTKIHEGLGTGLNDPYERTLPNMESRPPASTVLSTSAPLSPSAEEVERLQQAWHPLATWVDGSPCRLQRLIEREKVSRTLCVSPAAIELLSEVETVVVPSISSDPADQQRLLQWWSASKQAFDNCSQHLLDKQEFLKRREEAFTAQAKSLQELNLPSQPLTLALEVLQRHAATRHNEALDGLLACFLASGGSSTVFDANVVWQEFLTAVEEHKKDLFQKEDEMPLYYAWEGLLSEGSAVRPPSCTAPVALFFSLCMLFLRQRSGPAPLSPYTLTADRYLHLVSNPSRRRFVCEKLSVIFNDAELLQKLAGIMRMEGHLELHRDLSVCEATLNDSALRRLEVEQLANAFQNIADVKSLFTSLMASTDVEAKHHLCETLHVTRSGDKNQQRFDWGEILKKAEWSTHWKSLAVALLSDPQFLHSTLRIVMAAINAKGTIHRDLFDPTYAEALRKVKAARELRRSSRQTKLDELTRHFSSNAMEEKSTLIFVREFGMTSDALDTEAAQTELLHAKQSKHTVSAESLRVVLQAVRHRHPEWVASRVIPDEAFFTATEDSAVHAVQLMLRMFVRLTYVPHAGAAMIANRTRRRIGPVGLKASQFNVLTEFGMVEQYDNLQYKQYDWQGWYQRMVDIHNRNVSIRCRIGDLKRLDSNGNPFVDFQTERRLRIVSGDRVGMGVVKLDSDKYEDQEDNIIFGSTKLSELLAESRKAQLGPEYWPTVEVKVRKPSGQSQAYYSVMDESRIEKQSMELYEKYKEKKKQTMFVTPMDTWLEVKGSHATKKADTLDEHGYSVASLQDSLND